MNYSNDLYREIILEHVNNPKNKGNIEDKSYLKAYLKNPSCGDDVLIFVLLDNNLIKDIKYNASGCSICLSSVSIMSELLIGKTKEEANIIIENFNNMIMNKEYDKNILKDGVALSGVANLPPRIKCATLGYKAYMKAVGDLNE